ncbi:MAG: polyprenyl synthetase family protein [Firmicutes bacterium]|nr:polyprenyl synthetase family protein [Bacillota bacterium]
MDIGEWMERARQEVDAWIREDIEAMGVQPGSVEEAMRYSLTAGGKRLRPLLVLAAGEYVGLSWPLLKPVALAVEYVHTYSLIHDDLPAMDNDDFRRGRPTSHKVFGEAMAILAGDALLTEAFVKMAELAEGAFEPRQVLKATQWLAVAIGRQGLIQGQVRDLAAEHQDIGLDDLRDIHLKKTGALFEASVTIPAILANASEDAEALRHFGRHFGLAFQMVDDILNVVGDPALLGKATGTDAGLGKATYPRLVGVERARALVNEESRLALEQLDAARYARLEGILTYAQSRSW